MPWVITRLCVDCKDTECVSVCPVDCIYELVAPDPKYHDQLFIHPEQCIDCSACEPACPWEAIFQDIAVPGIFRDDVAKNAEVFKAHPMSHFTSKPVPNRLYPTPEEVAANKRKWGYR